MTNLSTWRPLVTVFKQYNESTSEWETILVGKQGQWDTAQTINAQIDSYTLLTADAGKLVTLNKGTAVNCTVDGSLNLAVGQRIDIIQLGAGQVTVVGSGATVNGTPGLKFRAQYSAATLICLSTDTYVLVGDLSA
jgi:5,10-methylene-tetrahydrofolate dehydrogenase/methenyl tetrahydrofolate cyclohydrolase